MKRVFIIVLDSLGIGAEPDAADFGDVGANTLRSVSAGKGFAIPHLLEAGMGNLDGVDYLPRTDKPTAALARLRERSRGKDTTIGHWELAGVVSPTPLPTYPDGFPAEVLDAFTQATGRGVLCNKPYSGTEVIKDYGEEHLKTGKLIVYTSADSVFQIAAHESLVPPEQLYEYCRAARKILQGEHGVGRVIARPFEGEWPFRRTTNGHDFSLIPPRTMLNAISEQGQAAIGVGKINDIFVGEGITKAYHSDSSVHGMEQTIEIARSDFHGLCFTNLVDFDALWGHRRNPVGYAQEIEKFDRNLGVLLESLRPDDLLILTADHGNDPTHTGTDHTREKVFFVAYSPSMKEGGLLPQQDTFAVIGATLADNFQVKMPEGTIGHSILESL